MSSLSRSRLQFWLISVCALAAVLLALGLGRWQLSRADQKQALSDRLVQQGRQPPLDLALVLDDAAVLRATPSAGGPTPLESLIDRPAVAQGQWLPRFTVYLDNRQMSGRQGFFVITPFQIEGSRRVVLVQRGWAPRDFMDRSRLPAINTPDGTVTLSGRLLRNPGRLFEFAEGAPVSAASSAGASSVPSAMPGRDPGAALLNPIRQNIDLGAYRTETGLPLWDLMLLETGKANDGLQRDWPEPSFGVAKHHGYAFQWFGLGVLISVLYVWFQLVPRFRVLFSRR